MLEIDGKHFEALNMRSTNRFRVGDFERSFADARAVSGDRWGRQGRSVASALPAPARLCRARRLYSLLVVDSCSQERSISTRCPAMQRDSVSSLEPTVVKACSLSRLYTAVDASRRLPPLTFRPHRSLRRSRWSHGISELCAAWAWSS